MLFSKNEIVVSLWTGRIHFRETKPQVVAKRAFHSLSFRLSGRVSFEIDGQHHLSLPNGITFIPAGVDYVTHIEEDGEMLVIHFTTKSADVATAPLFLDNRTDLKNSFETLCKQPHAKGESTYRCMSHFYALLDTLCKPQQGIAPCIHLAKHLMDTQFTQKIHIAALAKEAGISEVHFRNKFKEYYGVSPLAYLKQVRIHNAKQLLRSGYYSVTDVALECGFENVGYFSYTFKQLTGVSPTAFMNA